MWPAAGRVSSGVAGRARLSRRPVLNLSEQITWVSQIVGADYLGLQNAGAEYLGPFFAKSGADYLG